MPAPLQMIALTFRLDVDAESRLLAEVDRIEGRGVLRVLDLIFLAKGQDGMVAELEVGNGEDFDESSIVDAIARTDYDQPVARQRTAVPVAAPALPREGGVFRRFLDGFRYE